MFLGFVLILGLKRRYFFSNYTKVASLLSQKAYLTDHDKFSISQRYHTDIWNLHQASQNFKAKPYPLSYIP